MNEEMAKHLAVPITLALSLCGACIAQNDAPCQPALLSKERAGAVDKAVRAFAQDVARDVTRDGPIAWQKYFSDSSEFFMAVNGHLVFPNGPAAKAAMTGVARGFTHIELRWGDDLRIDPLAPDLAVMAASYHEVRIDASGRASTRMASSPRPLNIGTAAGDSEMYTGQRLLRPRLAQTEQGHELRRNTAGLHLLTLH